MQHKLIVLLRRHMGVILIIEQGYPAEQIVNDPHGILLPTGGKLQNNVESAIKAEVAVCGKPQMMADVMRWIDKYTPRCGTNRTAERINSVTNDSVMPTRPQYMAWRNRNMKITHPFNKIIGEQCING